MRIVECVPNFSEGRNRETIDAISKAITSVKGIILLDVDPGEATNRTVYTFVGEPEVVLEAAFVAIAEGSSRIDMTTHSGEHPRMGACDVCPFIPVSGVSVEECVEMANILGKRVSEELGIPVYLYEHAAKNPERKSLSVIREGEYEALKNRILLPEMKPDYGPAKFNPKSGATVIGCREFLVAFNINLNTRSKKLANEIALSIREKGRKKKDEKGKFIVDENNQPIMEPGMFPECKAIGWYIDEFQRAQISINLTNTNITSIHEVFETSCELAAEKGIRVTGSEIVGVVPKKPLLEAGIYYLEKQKQNTGINEKDLITVAIQSLGLNDLYPFEPEKKVIELYLQKKNRLVDLSVEGFINECARDSMAPGGGSVSALCGSLGAALTSMVGNLSWEKKGFKKKRPILQKFTIVAQKYKQFFLDAIDRDTDAFNSMIAASRLPKSTEEEIELRSKAIVKATRNAAEIPLSVTLSMPELLQAVKEGVLHGNPNSITDVAVAGLVCQAGAIGAMYNVLINLEGMDDQDYVIQTRNKALESVNKTFELNKEIQEIVQEKLGINGKLHS